MKMILYITLYKKASDLKIYRHAISVPPHSLKKSIPYNQALRIKQVSSIFN